MKSNQEEQVRELLDALRPETTPVYSYAKEEAEKAILALLEQAETAARLSEVQRLLDFVGEDSSADSHLGLSTRLAELKGVSNE